MSSEGVKGWSGEHWSRPRYFDRLDRRHFPIVLNDMSRGFFGTFVAWHERPEVVAHSAAIRKLFNYLDFRITVKLAYVARSDADLRLRTAYELFQETVRPLVDSIAFDGLDYHARFRLGGGGRSPWVTIPVVGSQAPMVRRPRTWYDDFSADSDARAVLASALAAGAAWSR
jgi:hypothetical protein